MGWDLVLPSPVLEPFWSRGSLQPRLFSDALPHITCLCHFPHIYPVSFAVTESVEFAVDNQCQVCGARGSRVAYPVFREYRNRDGYDSWYGDAADSDEIEYVN